MGAPPIYTHMKVTTLHHQLQSTNPPREAPHEQQAALNFTGVAGALCGKLSVLATWRRTRASSDACSVLRLVLELLALARWAAAGDLGAARLVGCVLLPQLQQQRSEIRNSTNMSHRPPQYIQRHEADLVKHTGRGRYRQVPSPVRLCKLCARSHTDARITACSWFPHAWPVMHAHASTL